MIVGVWMGGREKIVQLTLTNVTKIHVITEVHVWTQKGHSIVFALKVTQAIYAIQTLMNVRLPPVKIMVHATTQSVPLLAYALIIIMGHFVIEM